MKENIKVGIKYPVYLSSSVSIGKAPKVVTKTGPYEKEDLERWVTHARKEYAEGIVIWEVVYE